MGFAFDNSSALTRGSSGKPWAGRYAIGEYTEGGSRSFLSPAIIGSCDYCINECNGAFSPATRMFSGTPYPAGLIVTKSFGIHLLAGQRGWPHRISKHHSHFREVIMVAGLRVESFSDTSDTVLCRTPANKGNYRNCSRRIRFACIPVKHRVLSRNCWIRRHLQVTAGEPTNCDHFGTTLRSHYA